MTRVWELREFLTRQEEPRTDKERADGSFESDTDALRKIMGEAKLYQ